MNCWLVVFVGIFLSVYGLKKCQARHGEDDSLSGKLQSKLKKTWI